jgi:hypothetical protein
MLLDINGILAWGWDSSHKVHGQGLKKMTIFLKQVEQAKLHTQKISKLHGVFKIGHQNPISATEQKK